VFHPQEAILMSIDTQSRYYQQRWLGLLFICVSLLVIAIDNTILNVALPSISRSLGATASDLQWIVDAYILVFAALLLTMGSIGDRIGRKRILQAGLVLFGVGSLWAALATTTEMLIAARAFLGLGAAIIMPATLSLITATFPAEERSQAIALWAAVFGLGVGTGPVIGGWLLESYDWNAVFFVNLPVILLALVGGAYYLAESRDEDAPSADWVGVALSIPGLFALVYGIIEAGVKSWTDPQVLAAFGIAGVLLIAFALWESRASNAMLPLSFFRNMSFTGANTTLAMLMFGMFGSVFFLSQYLQTVLGFTALETGIRIVPLAVTMAVMAALSAQVTQRLGTKLTVTLGTLILAGGLFYMSTTVAVDSSYSVIVIGLIAIGAGIGLAISPATDSIMGSVPPNKAGIGSAMNDTTRELGGALGVAILGTIMNTRYIKDLEALRETLPMMPGEALDAVADSIQAAHIVAASPQVPSFAREMIISTADQAFVSGMSEAMFIGSIIMLAAAVVAFILLPSEVQASAHDTTVSAEKGAEALGLTSPAIGD
jgi:EmrB/QacA subfamily drug resistance transporter